MDLNSGPPDYEAVALTTSPPPLPNYKATWFWVKLPNILYSSWKWPNVEVRILLPTDVCSKIYCLLASNCFYNLKKYKHNSFRETFLRKEASLFDMSKFKVVKKFQRKKWAHEHFPIIRDFPSFFILKINLCALECKKNLTRKGDYFQMRS